MQKVKKIPQNTSSMEMSVLLENTPLVKPIGNYSQHLSGIYMYSTSSMVKNDIDEVISCFLRVVCTHDQFVSIYNKKDITRTTVAWRNEIWFLFSWVKNNTLPLKNKIHIFAQNWNILNVVLCTVRNLQQKDKKGETCTNVFHVYHRMWKQVLYMYNNMYIPLPRPDQTTDWLQHP